MDSADEILNELEAVLAAPKFARSPVQSRLLNYLVLKTIAGEGQSLKSYSVAVEGLGRTPDFDFRNDTYPRVQVARLRKSLDAFYATSGCERPKRLLIDQGSYVVDLVANMLADLPASSRSGNHAPVSRSLVALRLASRVITKARAVAPSALIAVVVGIVISFYLATRNGDEGTHWHSNNFPAITVSAREESGSASTEFLKEVASRYEHAFANYDSILVKSSDQKADFEIVVTVGEDQNISYIQVFDKKRKRLLPARGVHMQRSPDVQSLPDFIARSAFDVAGQTGTIHAYSRRLSISSDTQYGCWLSFTSRIRDSVMAKSDDLEACSKSWFEAAPQHPVAAGLYAWSLTDRSLVEFSSAARRSLIDQAVAAVDRAKDLNPQSPFINIAATRVYAVAGETRAMQSSASRLLTLVPDNLDAIGLAGLMLALHNDARGEPILRDVISRNQNPLPYYFVGLYVSAMMRDDPSTAREALDQFRSLKHTLPIIPILSAACEARSGRFKDAREQWNLAKSSQPILAVNPDVVFDRLPVAPAVRARLKLWLEPIVS